MEKMILKTNDNGKSEVFGEIYKAIDKVDSIPKAARAIPYISAKVNEMKIVRAMKVTGIKVL